jgi:hypothetical protein
MSREINPVFFETVGELVNQTLPGGNDLDQARFHSGSVDRPRLLNEAT